MPVNFGILTQPQVPQNNTQVIQTAPQGSGGDDIMGGIKGLLGGVFGKSNPVSQANNAISQTMAATPLGGLAKALLPSFGQSSVTPQAPTPNASNGLLGGLKQMSLGNDSAAPNSFQQYQQQLQQKQQQNQQPGNVKLASMTAAQTGSPYQVASSFLGDGRQAHAEVLEGFFQKSGVGKVNIQNTPWCAGFANAVLKSTGHGGTDSLAARSFLNYGKATSQPSQGDVVVFSDLTGNNNPAHGHVGFYAGEGDKPGYIKVLGGNQSGMVRIQEYPASKVLGYRVPPTAEELQAQQQKYQQQQQMQ